MPNASRNKNEGTCRGGQGAEELHYATPYFELLLGGRARVMLGQQKG